MPRFLSLLMAAALTASCGPSQPTETVDFLVAHPERLKEVQRLCKEGARRPAKNSADVPPRPRIAASLVTGRSRSPNKVTFRRGAATKFSQLPHHAAARSRMRHFYCLRHRKKSGSFGLNPRHNGL